MIYYLSPHVALPTGGVHCLYIHIRLLNDVGHPAVLMQERPFDLWWADPPVEVPIVQHGSVHVGPGDTVIIPECMAILPGDWGERFPYAGRRILFIQNRIWYDAPPGWAKQFGYHDIMVVSRNLANWVQRRNEGLPIHLVRPCIMPGAPWQPSPKEANRVLILARRRPETAEALAQELSHEGFNVDLVSEPLAQRQLYEDHLRPAEFYCHTVWPEGFPMACVEAMLSGTIVCGFTGRGGVELMHQRETAWACQDGQIGQIVEGMRILRDDAHLRSKIWQQAHEWAKRYTPEATREELGSVYGQL